MTIPAPTDSDRSRDLAADYAACEAATPGPWHAESIARGVRHLERNVDWYGEDCPYDNNLPGRNGGDGGMNDGTFIAIARTALPAALRRLADAERLRDEAVVACREAMAAIDESYAATGYCKVANTSIQRLRIEAILNVESKAKLEPLWQDIEERLADRDRLAARVAELKAMLVSEGYRVD